MQQEIGASTINDLYSDVPPEVRVKRPLNISGLPSEQDVREHIEELLGQNRSASDQLIFLGAGLYGHYVPAAVRSIISRTEFQTSYTPYQAEASQGLLQALFEFQSMMADLTGMDVVNASLYDWATALGEAARMALRANGRKKILVPRCIHPDKLSVLGNYVAPAGAEIQRYEYDEKTGEMDLDDIASKVDGDTSAIYAEIPTYFGILDSKVAALPSLCRQKGALSIIGFEPTSLGGLKPPGEYGADIIVGEGQSLATGLNFGGPSLGIIGCRGTSLVRQMPGRLIGMTTTIDGKDRAFSMVLQTREQHIRRERATSNICTNEALLAVGAAAYLSLLGPSGFQQMFRTIFSRTAYAMKRLGEISRLIVPRFENPHYQEFVLSLRDKRGSLARLHDHLLRQGVQAGKSLAKDFPELGESALLCVTEMHSREAIDKLCVLMGKHLEL